MRTPLHVKSVCGFALILAPLICEAGSGKLDCKLLDADQRLDYEFRLVANYRIRVPAAPFGEHETTYRLRTTVRAVEPPNEIPVIAARGDYRMPPVPEDAEEMIQFSNVFAFGEGTYAAEWNLELEDGRACQVTWAIHVKRQKKLRGLPSPLGPGGAQHVMQAMYLPEDSVTGVKRPLRVKVFLNLDRPQRRRSARTGPIGGTRGGMRGPGQGGRGGIGGPRGGGGGGGPRGRGRPGGRRRGGRGAPRANWTYSIGVLRSLSRDPRTGEVALVAYSVEDQKTVFRHGFRSGFDFPSLLNIRGDLSPNTVDIGDLDPESDNAFLGDLLVREMAEDEAADIYIFYGPEAQYGDKPTARSLEAIGEVSAPIFFLNHQRGPNWDGLIKNSVKALGGKELTVHSPEDLWKAMQRMFGQRGSRQ